MSDSTRQLPLPAAGGYATPRARPSTRRRRAGVPPAPASAEERTSGLPASLAALLIVGVAALTVAWLLFKGDRPYNGLVAAAVLFAGVLLAALRPAALPVLFLVTLAFNREARRVIDWLEGEFLRTPPTSLLPTMLGLLMGLVAVVHWRQLPPVLRRALMLIGGAVAFAFAVGLTHRLGAVLELLGWVAPLGALAFAVWLQPSPRTIDRWVMAQALTLAAACAYAWVQWSLLPPWDKFWVEQAGMASMGLPIPRKVRFIGPYHAPGGLAISAAITLIYLFARRRWRRPLGWAGVLFVGAAFLFSQSRSSWLMFAVGVAVYFCYTRAREKLRLVVVGVALVVAGITLLPLLPESAKIVRRLDTLTSLSDDGSFNARLAATRNLASQVARQPWGTGLGATGLAARRVSGDLDAAVAVDSGWLHIVTTLGLPGAALFAWGMFELWRLLSARPAAGREPTVVAGRAVFLSILAVCAASNLLKSEYAILAHLFAGAGIAATVGPAAKASPSPARREGGLRPHPR